MKNARFFDEHQDRNRPCYAHICYPKNEEPYYFWEERFQIDKCCQYKGQKISIENCGLLNSSKNE